MRIAIDARMMGAGNTRGIGRYIYETVEAMKRTDAKPEYLLLQPPIRWYTLAEQVKMPFELAGSKADVVWVPHWNVPLLYVGAPLVITVHDLLLLHQPASAKASTRGPLVSAMKRLGHRLVIWNAIHRAKKILVPTHEVEKDVIAHYPFAKNKLLVTGEGMTKLPPPSGTLPYGKFLFYFGSAYPHKRLDLLLFVWKTLAERHPDLSLVIGGEHDVFMGRVMEEAKRMNLPRVHFPGRLSDEALATHLTEAVAHVHPSSFEGFALPSLEALSLGCPTVVSDIPLMVEVLPKEGVFSFKNGDADGMIAAIETVLADPAAAHAAARLGGESAARTHDWNEVGRKTLSALESVAQHR